MYERTTLIANLNSTHEHSSVQFDFQMSNHIKNDAAAVSLSWLRVDVYCYNKFQVNSIKNTI